VKLVERFGAQGASKLKARENAEQVDYRVEQTDSVITFDSSIGFKKNSRFSFQRLDMELYIPFEQPFVIDHDLWRLIENHWRVDSDAGSYDVDFDNQETQTYKITKNGRKECITCPRQAKDLSSFNSEDQFGLKDFTEIDMTGAFDVVIRQGDKYAIEMDGSENQKKLYRLKVNGETLEVKYRTRKKIFWKEAFNDDDLVHLTITMPNLQKLNVTAAGKLKILGFHEPETKISMLGALVVDARLSARQLYLDLSGPIVFELEGEGDFLEATISKTAQFRADSYPVNHAIIEAKELGQARVNVSGTLEIDKDFTSNVRYQGNPEVVKK
jgi:hypothetical protein